MVQILKRRSSGYLKVESETITSKFHGKKWSKILNNNLQTIIVLLLCFANCWRETKASSSDGIITLPNTAKTLSQLFDICTNQTGHGFRTVEVIQVMHFDFCNEIHPVFFSPTSKSTNSQKTFRIESKNETNSFNFAPQTITFDSVYNCSNIETLLNQEAYYKKVFTDYSYLLDRTDDCTIQNVINCSLCKNTYREWVCSLFASQYGSWMNSKPACPYLFSKVCHDCPSVEPATSYGGYSIFQCVKDNEIETNCMENLTTNTSSCISFSCMPSYDDIMVRDVT